MKFTKQPGIQSGRPYRVYRQSTRQDFRRFCAYCFRHEDEAGGEAHFEQDHFEPKTVNRDRERDYYNLYWSCRECNGKQNKGENWPDAAQRAREEVFCDCCDHDPETDDYRLTGEQLEAITPAGTYTIDVLRLNERDSLRVIRKHRANVRQMYTERLSEYDVLLEAAKQDSRYESDVLFKRSAAAIEEVVASFRAFVDVAPFVLTDIPDPPAQSDTICLTT